MLYLRRRLQVRVLVEEGGANVLVQDRWGNTPLDEARRVGAALVVSYLEQAAVKRREADLARRAEQQRLLAAQTQGAAPVSNWRREQQLQQQLRSQEASELYRLRQVQAQQVRELSSSIFGGEGTVRSYDSGRLSPSTAEMPGQQAAPPGSQDTSTAAAAGGDAVVELMQLAQQAQQMLTLKVEEMEMEVVESLQQRRERLQAQQSTGPSSSSSNGGAAVTTAESSNSPSASRSNGAGRSNNVVPALKLQQPLQQPAKASTGNASP